METKMNKSDDRKIGNANFSRLLIAGMILVLALGVMFTGKVYAQNTTVDLQLRTFSVSDASPDQGQSITYTITIKAGTQPVSNVVVDGLLLQGVTITSTTVPIGSYNATTGVWNVGTLNSTANYTLTIVATVNSGTAARTFSNTATVWSSTNTDPDPLPGDQQKTVTVIVNGADLQVTKTVNNATPKVGENVVFTVVVRNNGPQATAFSLTDLLPAGLTYVSHTVPNGTYTPGTGIWSYTNNLNSAATVTMTITAKVNTGTIGTTIINTASITSATLPDSITGNNTSSASVKIDSTDLALSKSVNVTAVNEGDPVVFTLTVTNNGPDAGSAIVISDPVPAGVTFVSATPSQGSYVSTTGVWTVGSLANGASATLTMNVTVNTGTAGRTITNTGSVISADQDDPNAANNSASASFQVHGADLGVTKSVDVPNPVTGQGVVFTIIVTNYGPDPATNVRLLDDLNFRLRYTSATATQGSYNSLDDRWTVGSLAVGASATLTIRANVIEGATIPNTAIVAHSDQPDSNVENNQATVTLAGSAIFHAGSCVVDMGIPTTNAGLKPYGLIFDLVKNYQVPVYWSINPDKVKDGIDFSVNGVDYRGGPFIIPAEYVSIAQPAITLWRSRGAVINCDQPEFTAPIYDYITSFPNSVLDEDNGSIAAAAFFTPAQVPTTAYKIGGPEDLVDCDDVYIMPHADPHLWPITTKAIFQNFIMKGGALYAACHAVSSLESPLYGQTPLLSDPGLLDWNNHDDASGLVPYLYDADSATHPIMQYIGHVEGALDDGSEQIYMPVLNGAWRPTTTVAVWDPNQADVLAGDSPGKAALVAYGRAYGDPDYGMILYQASHSFSNGTVAEDTAAARTIGNLLLMVGIEERPQIVATIPDYVEAGLTESMSASITGGTPPYTYTWSSTCGGTFSNPNAASTSFTAPIVTSRTSCVIRLVVQDQCNRVNFAGKSITINGATGLEIDKSVSPEKVAEGDLVTYSIVPSYNGSLGLTNAAVTDVVPDYLTFVSANAGGVHNPGTNTITWDLGSNTPGVVGTVTGNPVGAGTETIYPSQDTWIDQRNPNNNYGTTATLVTTNKSGELSYPLLQFPLTLVPSGAAINSASLNLYLSAAQTNNTSTVYRMLTPWVGTAATWGDSDGTGTGDWQTAGSFGTSDYVGTTDYGTIINTPTGWKSTDVTSLVNGWINSGWTNNGVVLIAGGTSDKDASFYSRENTGDVLDPYLYVEWSRPARTGSLVAIRPDTFVVVGTKQIIVEMKVTTSYNTEDVTITPPAALTVSGGVTATLVSGPEPATAKTPDGGGSVDFAYVYEITAGTTPQNVTFSGIPTSTTAGVTFATGTSKSVIVSPVLQFQARVESPLAPNTSTINNTATICDALVFQAPNCKEDSALIMTFPVGGTIGDRIWLDEDGDGLQDAGESGIANVQVIATWYGPDGLPGGGDDKVFSTWTDTSGNYIFNDLPAGNYRVAVNNATLADGLEANPTFDFDGTGTAGTAAVTLTPGQSFTSADFGYNWSSVSDVMNNTGFGALGDKIWVDANGDGVQDLGEPGLAGVTVTLYRDDNGDGIFDSPYATTTTGPDGTYIFDNLPAGAYEVAVTPPTGYSPTYDPDGILDNRTTQPVIVSPGDVYVNADFGYQADPGMTASIGDSIWQDSNGNGVLDPGELGIPGVTVSLIQDTNGNGVWDPGEPIIAATVSDATGSYTFDGLPVGGDYLVWVSDTANVLAGLEGTYDGDGTATPNISAVSDLPVTGSHDQNFGYASPSQVDYNGVIGSSVWYDADGDGMQDPGEGIPGVVMDLTWYGPDGMPGGGDDIVYTTTTDANGNYSFSDLPAGNYKVAIDPSNYNPGMPLEGLTISSDPDGMMDGSSTVTLPTNGSVDLEQNFGLTGPDPLVNSVISTIFQDLNGDGVQGPGESGIPGVVVELTWYGPDGVPGGGDDVIYTTVTDANGNYSFDNLPDGYFEITTDLPSNTGPGGVLEGLTPTDPGANASHLLSLDPEGSFATPAVEGTTSVGYRPGNGAGDEGLIASTVWYDADGNGMQDAGEVGIPGVLVTLTNGTTTWTTYTDANGNYVFADLPAGTFTVTVAASNFTASGLLYGLTNTYDATAPYNSTSTVTLATNTSVDVNQDFGYYSPTVDPLPNSASSVVFNDADGDGMQDPGELGIPGVVVQLNWYGPDGMPGGDDDVIYTTVTDADGNYTFDNLPDGYFGITTDLLVNTDAGGPLEGLFPTDMGNDGSSTFSLDPTHASSTGVADNDQAFGYSPSEPQTNIGVIGDTIYLDRDGDGMADTGEGLEGVRVDLYAADGVTLLATRYTDANGNYSFGGLAEGTYYVKIVTTSLPGGGTGLTNSMDPDGGTANMSMLSITSTNPTRLDQDFGYTATTPNTIQGTLWNDLDGDGTLETVDIGRFAGVTVVLYDQYGNVVATTVTDANGYYSFTGIPNGSYSVKVTDTTDVINGDWTSVIGPNSMPNPAPVTVSGGQTAQADFGYFEPSSQLGNFVWNDLDMDGIQDAGEPGMAGIEVKLTITYPNGTSITVVTETDTNGYYSFNNLLLDENFTGTSASEPIFSITLTPPLGYLPTESNMGTDPALDSNEQGVPIQVLRGSINDTVDFGLSLIQPSVAITPNPLQVEATPGSTVSFVQLWENTGTHPDVLDITVYDIPLNFGVTVYRDGSTSAPALGAYTTPLACPSATCLLVATETGGDRSILDNHDTINPANDTKGDNIPDTGNLNQNVKVNVILSVTVPMGTMPGDYVLVERASSYNDWKTFHPALVYNDDQVAHDEASKVIRVPGVTIGDRLWVDENSNGQQDLHEPGIANVQVVATWYGPDGVAGGGDDIVFTTLTDANGEYIFTMLPGGNYNIAVNTATLAVGLEANPTFDYDGIASANSTELTLVAGTESYAADFGYNWSSTNDVLNNSGPGAIGDKLWVDTDGDGIQDPSEIGMSGVTVTLYSDPDGNGVYDTVVATVVTAADGSYIFDDVPAGGYVIGVTVLAGYTTTGDPDTTMDGKTSLPLILAPGDVYLGADFGFMPTAGSTIGDQIYLDVNGDGTFDLGEPGIAGVTVSLLDANGNVVATTTTDANGNYVFTGVPAGTYTVWVNDTMNVLGNSVLTGDPDGTKDEKNTITVDGTSPYMSSDFGYAPAVQTPLTGMIGQSIFLDADGDGMPGPNEGLEGVTVKLYDSTGTILLATAVTDENGHYNFGGLDPNGTYQVQVDTTTLPAGVANTYDPDGTKDAMTTVALSLADPFDMEANFGFVPTTPNSISGTLWLDSNMDGVMDMAEMARFAGVTVSLYDAYGNVVATTVTDANGHYNFSGLPAGTYTVDVTDTNNLISDTMRLSMGLTDPKSVSVSNGSAGTADFGYYDPRASVGNLVFNDYNKNGIQDGNENGIVGMPVSLVVTYSDGTISTITVLTDESGHYCFDYLLIDEQFVGNAPTYKLRLAIPAGWLPSPADAGSDDAMDSDGVINGSYVEVVLGSAPNAALLFGQYIETYDFGFNASPTAIGSHVEFSEVTPNSNAMHVVWITDDETDISPADSFLLYRALGDEDNWTQVDTQIAKWSGSPLGDTYEYWDLDYIPGMEYTYKLEVALIVEGTQQNQEILSEAILALHWSFLPSMVK